MRSKQEETFRYNSTRQRILKISSQQNRSVHTLYLPGVEVRITTAGIKVHQKLQIITVGKRAQMRVLHWETGKPEGIRNNLVCYSNNDLISSSGLELDADGDPISLETYYPFGGTAIWATHSQTKTRYKTIRYAGKERDATGLYYYGCRYYAPWLMRWLNPDPAGAVDGMNVFRMVRNNPAGLKDEDGCMPVKGQKRTEPNAYSNSFPSRRGHYQKIPNAVLRTKATATNRESSGGAIADTSQYNIGRLTMVKTESIMTRDKNRSTGLKIVKNAGDVFRYDTRSPREIMKKGFTGTNAVYHPLAFFGERTVFCSESRTGAEIFKKNFEAGNKKPLYNLYKINAEGLETVSLSLNSFLYGRENLIKYMASRKIIERNLSEQFMNTFTEKYCSTVKAMLTVDEIQIQGPVTPDRITPLSPPGLDYLDLAWW